MKFKAKLGADGFSSLQSVVQTLSKVGQSCVLHLSPEKLTFAVLPDAGAPSAEDMQVFATLNQRAVFADMRIQSLNGDQISLELAVGNLLRALNSGRSAPMLQIKLAKRGAQATLCVELRQMELEVQHDVPVRVLRASEAAQFQPPSLPTPEVRLELPRLRTVRAVVERMKAVDNLLLIEADMRGDLSLRAQTEMASIATYFKHLVSRSEQLSGEPVDTQHRSAVKVDVRLFARMLASQSVQTDTAIICIIEQYALVLHLILAPAGVGSVTYYVPILAEDD